MRLHGKSTFGRKPNLTQAVREFIGVKAIEAREERHYMGYKAIAKSMLGQMSACATMTS